MKYRIDFSRLARSEEEIFRSKDSLDFIRLIIPNFRDNVDSGHILDSVTVEDKRGLSGRNVL